jgi:hypothetical protein
MNQLPLLLPLQDELKAICSALVSGARYGVKIRLPHAVVMTGLFRRDLSAPDKLRSIVRLVREHATNLAAFAGLYKFILALLKWSSRRHFHIDKGAEGSDEIRPWLRSILAPSTLKFRHALSHGKDMEVHTHAALIPLLKVLLLTLIRFSFAAAIT